MSRDAQDAQNVKALDGLLDRLRDADAEIEKLKAEIEQYRLSFNEIRGILQDV